jgi:hypothetical protein
MQALDEQDTLGMSVLVSSCMPNQNSHIVNKHRPLKDTVARNAFIKFETNVMKKFEAQLESMNEEELRQMEGLTEMFEDLDDIIPLDDEENFWIDAPKKGTKRCIFFLLETIFQLNV